MTTIHALTNLSSEPYPVQSAVPDIFETLEGSWLLHWPLRVYPARPGVIDMPDFVSRQSLRRWSMFMLSVVLQKLSRSSNHAEKNQRCLIILLSIKFAPSLFSISMVRFFMPFPTLTRLLSIVYSEYQTSSKQLSIP